MYGVAFCVHVCEQNYVQMCTFVSVYTYTCVLA